MLIFYFTVGFPPISAALCFITEGCCEPGRGLGNIFFYSDLLERDFFRWTTQTECSRKPKGILK